MTRRLFIAVEPPPPVRRRLAAIQAEMKRLAGRNADDVRWVGADNLHVTLQFLGSVPEERVEDVKAALAGAAAEIAPLHLELRGAGAFPHGRKPRVLWAGLSGDVDRLTALAASIGNALAPLGFTPEDRPFSPHVTLGRSREPRGAPRLAAAIAGTANVSGPGWRVVEVDLVQSHLSPTGARYETIARAALGASLLPGG
ncbi:MAG TPA: RNA 2',3'-cyclic phosphodiesterase [Anaeromyxobacteraceae bacterium]|nr:RNA 2',3'-cyclic phosphodiesterase [Anaeromyxobacteraceae bacterium]